MPLGAVSLTVKRTEKTPPIPLSRINQIEEGDQILYSPSLRPNEKREGRVTVVLVAAKPSVGEANNFAILEAKDARKTATWNSPFRASLAVYVYGPAGLSTKKLKGFLVNDQELIAQLADYAEKTAQTEAVLQAVSTYETSGSTETLGAALQGFARQYGASNKIDRNAPLNDQTLAALRSLNPALSAYDPISPSSTQRISQTAGLAATVAGLFLGSTVGLAAGGTALGINMKTLLFPDTDFRSAYTQPWRPDAVALCTSREPVQSRKRIGYLWATRLPDTAVPAMAIEGPNHLPAGLKTPLKLNLARADAKLVSRARDWKLKGTDGKAFAVPATPLPDASSIELNLSDLKLPAGGYSLTGSWDWESFEVAGKVFVDELGTFGKVGLTPESQNRLRQHSGKQIVTLTGADFQFVEKLVIVRRGDKYDSPAPVPFSLPKGRREGPQDALEMQVDTTNLGAGAYELMLYQQDGKSQDVAVRVLPDPPKLTSLPLTLHEDQREAAIVLEGEDLQRITGLSADGVGFKLDPSGPLTDRRSVQMRQLAPLPKGTTLDLRLSVEGYAAPIVLAGALQVAGQRPKILEARPSLPASLPIALRPGELPAGLQIGIMMKAGAAGPQPAVRLQCRDSASPPVRIQMGRDKDGIKLQFMQEDSFFLSLDPGSWPGGCVLLATLETGAGRSEPFELGRVIRLPLIEKFELTNESAGEGSYTGILTGRDLELIGQVGWDASTPQSISALPAPIAGEGAKQSLRVRLPWPSPAPHSPLFVWFRGESEGRSTTVRY